MRHRFHALCPYFAMFPESFAERWVDRLTKPDDIVLDPFCGRGTAPFQALLMGRRAVGNDINPVAYCVTRAKTRAPSFSTAKRRLLALKRQLDPAQEDIEIEQLPEFFLRAYSEPTLRQLMHLRSQLNWRESDVDCMIAALALGSLHGESLKSPAYFSNQMPRTISTKPAYSIRFWEARNLDPRFGMCSGFSAIVSPIRYVSERPNLRAIVLCGDMRELPRRRTELPKPIRCVITSPPLFGCNQL